VHNPTARLTSATFGLGALLAATAIPAQVPSDVRLEPFASGLSGAVGLKAPPDGSGRLFVVEQAGTVRIVESDGVLRAAAFIDISSRVACCGERGLLDLAFHPGFATNGRFFLHYSAGSVRPPGTASGDTVVAEFRVSADPNRAEPEPVATVLTVAQDFSNHNGGQMEFGPDGYLYLGLGDGGSANDPCNRAQTLNPELIVTGNGCRSAPSVALLGKILRIDVHAATPAGANNLCAAAADGSANYAVPPDNPFFGQSGRCGEVLAWGLRNPWRFSFDRASGDMWIGDVGQNQWEEIDLLPAGTTAGVNLGWNCFEGSSTFQTSRTCARIDHQPPVLEYSHAENGRCSVTGGYRYRGPVQSLVGRYVYGDFCSGEIWLAQFDGGSWTAEVFDRIAGFSLRSFGEDAHGDVYVVTPDTVLRFAGDSETLFADGFESPPAPAASSPREVSTKPAQ